MKDSQRASNYAGVFIIKKPNIIFLMTDQQNWDCIGVLNPHIKTPNLDKLAKQGIIYNQAVAQCPMCVPSRNSMMFGMYPSQLGVRTNASVLYYEDKLPSLPLPEIMLKAGYQTAGFGKTHWCHGHINKEPPTRGFEVRAIGQSADSRCYEHGALMMGDENPEGLNEYFEETKDYGSGEENANGYIGCTSEVQVQNHRDGWVAQKCLEFLDEGIDPDRPLFLYLSFLKPHAGFNVPKEFEDMYNVDDIPDLKFPEFEEENTHLSYIRDLNPKMRKTYEDRKEVISKLSEREKKRIQLRYWANCTWLDNYFGLVLRKLEEKGRLDNCIILYTSDHGDMMGQRNYMYSKYCLYENSIRVPLILSGSIIPEEKRGMLDMRLAELVDIVPTLSKIAGHSVNPMLPGLDLLGEEKRSGAFAEFHGGGNEQTQPSPAYMWRKERYKLIIYIPTTINKSSQSLENTKGELYDLKNDPTEYNNLYYDNNYRDIREQLKTELLMHLACAWAKAPFYYDSEGFSKILNS